MTKNFDSICQRILGETVVSPAQPAQQGQPTKTLNQSTSTTTPPTSATASNDEVTKAFDTLTKHAANNQEHVKALAALQQLMTAQQQNAANKPK